MLHGTCLLNGQHDEGDADTVECPGAPEVPADPLAGFLVVVAELRRSLNIRRGKGTDRDRRRIALAVADAWLRWRGMLAVHEAPMVEGVVYANTAGLVCDLIPEEERCDGELKLFTIAGSALPERPGPHLARVLAVLRAEEESIPDERDDDERRGAPDQPERVHGPRHPGLGARGLQGDGLAVASRHGLAGHPGGGPALLPRARRGRLASGARQLPHQEGSRAP
jgi:hypothetical protein